MTESKYSRLAVDPKLVAKAAALRESGKSQSQIAEALECGAGKAALLLLLNDEKPIKAKTDKAVAQAVAKGRDEGASWGTLMARTGLTLPAVKQAYEDATGTPAAATNEGKGRPRKVEVSA